jgi:hypothetical protein
MIKGEYFSNHFRYGPDVWGELVDKVERFCSRQESCAGECPFDLVRVPALEILTAYPDFGLVLGNEVSLCNLAAIFTRPEQAAAIVGYQLHDLNENSGDAALIDSNISFSDLFAAE